MYTVGSDYLPEAGRTAEAFSLMTETLADASEGSPPVKLLITCEVYSGTDDPALFEVLGYCGVISSIIPEPPSFNMIVDEAWRQISPCDCPEADIDGIFEDFEQAMEEVQLSNELDEFAGAPTEDRHYEALAHPANTEVTIRFDRLGFYGVHGVFK